MRHDNRVDDRLRLSRRAMCVAGLSGAAAVVPGCSFLSTEPTAEDENSGSTDKDQREAPALAARVKAGDLPALAERLPEEPMEVTPNDRAGTYGGTWNSALLGTSDTAWLTRTVDYESLLRWSLDWTVVPNIASSWEMEQDGARYVFTLRPGMKWSDGTPFTADDIEFAYNDVLLNEEIYPVPPSFVVSDDQPAEFEKIDEFTVAFTFATPNTFFPEYLCYQGRPLCAYPLHYLKEFHPRHNPDVATLAEEEGFPSWVELFDMKAINGYWQNADIPTVTAWQVTRGIDSGSRMVLERNPYYWKVDPEGRQLPYLDSVTFDLVNDEEVILLKASSGEIDFHTRHINTLENKPVLAASREQGDYGFVDIVPAIMNYAIVSLNLACKDTALREIFQRREFRIGLSHAINREEINQAVFKGQGIPWQAAPHKASDYYHEQLATQYLEFDEDLANDYLDRAGLTERDSDGFRLRPDGERLRFSVEIALPSLYPATVDVMEMVKQYWHTVGVDMRTTTEDRSLFEERRIANEHAAVVWPGGGGLKDAIIDPALYFPFSTSSQYAIAWGDWYNSGGSGGMEPSAVAREQMGIYDEIRTTADEGQRAELFKQILDLAAEEFYAIGTIAPQQEYGIVKNSFHNVPDGMPEAYTFNTPGPSNPEQFFTD